MSPMLKFCSSLTSRNILSTYSRTFFQRRLCSNKPQSTTPASSSGASYDSMRDPNLHRPTDWQKKCLVWTKKYKTVEDVPEYVNSQEVNRAYNRLRIKVANISVVTIFALCIAMMVSGKKALGRGETVHNERMKVHEGYEAARQKDAADKLAASGK